MSCRPSPHEGEPAVLFDPAQVPATISGLVNIANYFPLTEGDHYKLLVTVGMLMEIENGSYID